MQLCSQRPSYRSAAADAIFQDGFPDRNAHTYCFGEDYPPNNTVRNQMVAAMDRVPVLTVVGVSFHLTCGANTDVRWQQRFVDGSAAGDTWCVEFTATPGVCDRWRIRIDWGTIQAIATINPTAQTRKTTCHELGHSLGLAHYPSGYRPAGDPEDTCMMSGLWQVVSYGSTSYGPHHINGYPHINWWWAQP